MLTPYWQMDVIIYETIIIFPIYILLLMDIVIARKKLSMFQSSYYILVISQGIADILTILIIINLLLARYFAIGNVLTYDLQDYGMASFHSNTGPLLFVLRLFGVFLITLQRYLAVCRNGGAMNRKRKQMSGKIVKGFLLDITGVLYNSRFGTDGVPIPMSAEAIQILYEQSKVKFLSNAKGASNVNVKKRLERLGILIREEDVITPAPIVAQYLKNNNLRPHLFVRKDVMEYFDGIDISSPNCVVMGEVEDGFSFDRINKAFRILLDMEKPFLITMGNGKFFQRTDGPCIDIGAFAAALKFSTNCEVLNIGKPSQIYFQEGIDALGLEADEIVMIGDDIISDVGGAQAAGMRGIQVRTGKWRADTEKSSGITPDLTVDCLYDAIKQIRDNGFVL